MLQLSPYLFLVCAEGLTSILHSEVLKGHLHGIKVARSAPSISHLLFADDSFIFFRANQQEHNTIKNCLIKYESGSGQKVNMSKSSLFQCQCLKPIKIQYSRRARSQIYYYSWKPFGSSFTYWQEQI